MTSALTLKVRRHLLEPDFSGYKLSLESTSTFVTDIDPVHLSRSSLKRAKYGLNSNKLIDDPYCLNQVYMVNHNSVLKIILDENQRSISIRVVANVDNRESNTNVYEWSLVFASENQAILSDGQGFFSLYDTGSRKDDNTQPWKLIYKLTEGHQDLLQKLNKSYFVADAKAINGIIHLALVYVGDADEDGGDYSENEQLILLTRFVIKIDDDGKWIMETLGEELFFEGDLEYARIMDNYNMAVVTNKKFGTSKSSHKNTQEGAEKKRTKNEVDTDLTMSNDTPSLFWRQTNDELIIFLPLTTKPTSKHEVAIEATSSTLKVELGGKGIMESALWSTLDESTLTWSLESDNRILEISVSKKEEGAHWPKLLKDEQGELSEMEVPDDTNASNIAQLCYNTDVPKYTPLTFNSGLLEECDADPENELQLIVLSTEGVVVQQLSLLGHQWLFSLNNGCFCLRHDVDGLLWQLINASSGPQLDHLATFNALGYVQASKTTRKYTVCSSDYSFAAIVDCFKHIYVYHQPSMLNSELRNRKSGQRVSHVAKQQVITIDTSDEILGVASVNNNAVLVLTQNQLRLIKVAN